jgi:hypothetical protein
LKEHKKKAWKCVDTGGEAGVIGAAAVTACGMWAVKTLPELRTNLQGVQLFPAVTAPHVVSKPGEGVTLHIMRPSMEKTRIEDKIPRAGDRRLLGPRDGGDVVFRPFI